MITRRPMLHVPARMAGVVLLLVWVGPVTFVQTGSCMLPRSAGAATADPMVIPSGQALILEPGTVLKLRMRDGKTIEGRYQGRALLDSTTYALRFAKHVHTSAFVPLSLEETLSVSLRDGREWTAPFAGYGELTLLLRNPVGRDYLRVPFEFAKEIRRANGDSVPTGDLSAAFRAGLLPSAEALEMTSSWSGLGNHSPKHFLVAVQDIEASAAEVNTGKDNGGMVAGVILISVIVSVVVFYALVNSMFNSASNGCQQASTSFDTQLFSELHLTTRPFDRFRGCYEGEELAVAEQPPSLGGMATAAGSLDAVPTAASPVAAP